jgi:hypothetical protein
MVALQEVERQLEAIGANSRFWGRAEIVELQHILVAGEQIQACLNGRYQGGFATFVATDQRLLLVDKKLFYLTVEDMRYDMIAEVDFSAQLFSGTMRVCTPTKNLAFTAYHPKTLRQVASYIQQRVMQVRHQYTPGSADDVAEQLIPAPQQAKQVPDPLPAPLAAKPAPTAVASPYARMLGLGSQAITASNTATTELPAPQRRNPYMNPPLMMRRRIGRFGPIGHTSTNLSQQAR